ncbi:penicillin acylase family protein [Deinococcus sp. DB0503]|uniref:penicillin acylase family protein n=1 Tax=Deinococcus sp. DB0503 TaxID=2479203 RepID=UPI00351C7D87
MRRLVRVGRGVLWVLLLVLLLALGAVVWLKETSRPQVSGTLTLPGLAGPVSVTRDAWGVPHIRAQASDEDAMFALGFVHAQDRAWQMDFQRRVAQGRLAEVLGEAALPQDRFLRTWGFYRAAQSALPALSEQARRMVRAYTAGVNAGFAQGRLAPEFRILGYTPEPWTDVDSIAWSKLMAYDLGGNADDEILGTQVVRRLGEAKLNEVLPPIRHRPPPSSAVKNWGCRLRRRTTGGWRPSCPPPPCARSRPSWRRPAPWAWSVFLAREATTG